MKPTDAQRYVAELYNKGKTVREIANATHTPLGTIRKWVTKLGVAGFVKIRGRGGREPIEVVYVPAYAKPMVKRGEDIGPEGRAVL